MTRWTWVTCALLCQTWWLGCGGEDGGGPGGTAGQSGTGAVGGGAGSAGQSGWGGFGGVAGSGFGGLGGNAGAGARDAAIGPGGCVLPGEVNEFNLPLCQDPTQDEDASVTDPACTPGFDALGNPVCFDDAGIPLPPPLPRCLRGGLCESLSLIGGGQLDVLFVIDNSGSMSQEQAALLEQMPQFIRALTRGDLDGDGTQDFAPARDLHVGVVSTDIGLPNVVGAGALECDAIGDDAALLHTPAAGMGGCLTSYPTFLSWDATSVDPSLAATDFACIASLGTSGCGYEQQLEATLRALTPSTSDIRFHAVAPALPVGQGDRANAGFLRRDSLLAIVMLTDEDDCSAREPRLFTPAAHLSDNDPLSDQPVNLRCHLNPEMQFPLSRYIEGLRALRPADSGLVLFAAIVGVPPALVTDAARAGVDFNDAQQRDAYYDAILAAPGMQETIDPQSSANPNLTPSCETNFGRAYPPRRIVQVAKAFGQDAVVQSICGDNFAAALRPVVDRVSRALTVGCLPTPFARDASGRIACDVVWELPPPNAADASLLLCDERPFLRTPSERDARTTADGRLRCLMSQVPIDSSHVVPADGSGFYYDDFSSAAIDQCGSDSDQRIVFTADVQTPADVRVVLDCAVQP